MQNHFGRSLPEELRLRHSRVRKSLGIAETFQYATNEHIGYFRKTEEDATPEIAKHFQRLLRGIISRNAKDTCKARFLDKSQSYTLKMPFIVKLLPESTPYFILVSRNPHAICLREAKARYRSWQNQRSCEHALHLVSEHWANSFNTALADGDGIANFMHIRFEDILEAPERSTEQICRFCELDYSDGLLPQWHDKLPLPHLGDRKWYPMRKDVNNRYLAEITEMEADIIREVCGDLLDRFDYRI